MSFEIVLPDSDPNPPLSGLGNDTKRSLASAVEKLDFPDHTIRAEAKRVEAEYSSVARLAELVRDNVEEQGVGVDGDWLLEKLEDEYGIGTAQAFGILMKAVRGGVVVLSRSRDYMDMPDLVMPGVNINAEDFGEL